jgi:hypothetical protein
MSNMAAGSGNLTVSAVTAYGVPLTKTLQVNVFNGACVSASAGAPGSEGTLRQPLSIIQDGIDKAVERYVTGPAEVRVAAGTYSVACSVNANPALNVYVADMAPGISLKGGYNASFSAQNGGATNLVDLSTNADNSSEGNPVRVVNVSGAGIASVTALNRFTISLGSGGTFSQTHCGIGCLNNAAPMISNNDIAGTGSATLGSRAIGILLSNSSPTINACVINPGKSITWSFGIYCSGSTTSTISNSSIYGGESGRTTGIISNSGTTPSLSQNTFWGGVWSIAGYCVYISGGSPSIDGNIFRISSNKSATYAIYEADAASDPNSLTDNDFHYTDDGSNWYFDEGATGVGSASGPGYSINNNSGDINLFNIADGNIHTP